MERDPPKFLELRLTYKISTHTLTWSVTYSERTIYKIHGDFNSHAHVERDAWGYKQNGIAGISTHTLTWSVTESPVACDCVTIFQLTRSRGA